MANQGIINSLSNFFSRNGSTALTSVPALQTITLTNSSGSKKVTLKLNLTPVPAPMQVMPHMDTEKALNEGYRANATVYSIVSATGGFFGSVPVYVFNDGTMQAQKFRQGLARLQIKAAEEKAQNHPYTTIADMNEPNIVALNALLQRPNEWESQDAFRDKAMQYYLITGECMIWCNRGYTVDKYFNAYDIAGNAIDDEILNELPILEIHCLKPTQVALIYDKNDPDPFSILGYEWNLNGQLRYIRKQDMIFWKNASLDFNAMTRSHLRGVSPLVAGGALLQQSNAAALAATRAFQNDGARGVLVNAEDTPEAVAPGQMDEIRGVIDEKINSNDVSGSVATILGKWTYLDLGKATSLPLIDGQKYADQQLCMLFKYPIELMQSQTTFANKLQATKNWINNTIIPACRQFDGELNRVLLKAFGLVGKVCICCDYSTIPALQDDLLQQAQAFALMPYLTYNQKLTALGYQPSADPIADKILVPTGVTPSDALQADLDSMNSTTDDNDRRQ